MNLQNKTTSFKFLIFLGIFFLTHLILFNVNVAEWGDSYRILRASEFLKSGSYPEDEKRPPLLSAVIATRPASVDQIFYARLILFIFSIASIFIFYNLLKLYTNRNLWLFWGMFALLFNNVYLYWSIRVMADVPFSFFVLLSIFLFEIWRKNLNYWKLFLLGLVCGLGVLTRFEGYLLLASTLGAVFLYDLKLSPKIVWQNISRAIGVLVGWLVIAGPYLYFNNPLNSSYLEEPTGRTYDVKMLLTYFVSLMCVYGLLTALPTLLIKRSTVFSLLKENLLLTFMLFSELLLILAWPAAVPRLFVAIIPFLIVVLTVAQEKYFESTYKDDRKTQISLFLPAIAWFSFFIVYFVAQYYLKLQFLMPQKILFGVNIIFQAVIAFFWFFKSPRLFFISSVIGMAFWSFVIINMHKNIFISVKNAAQYASRNYSGKIGYNDVSSVTDWYLNYSAGRSNITADYYSTDKKKYLEQEVLGSSGLDYLIITNEHNTTMTLDLNKRPYLKELKLFEYMVNGKKFETRIVEIL